VTISGPDGGVGPLRGFAGRPPCETPEVTIRDNRQLVAALLGVDGVAGASIEPTGAGPGTLRLQLAAGTDQVIVAGEVNRLLRSKFGLAVDPDRVRVIDESLPLPTPSRPSSSLGKHAVVGAAHAADDQWFGTDDGHGVDAPPVAVGAPPVAVGAPPAAVGAYARDALDLSAIISTDLHIANGVEHLAAPEDSLTRPSRLTIERVQLVSAGLGATVSVTLGLDGRGFEGAAEGSATQTGLLRSVAAATLRAVERIIDGSARFEVEHVEVARTGNGRTALVVVTMVTGRSTQRLSGASVVREDTRQAMIRAVLAALNRRMEPLLADQ
jgi:hypothetical protein